MRRSGEGAMVARIAPWASGMLHEDAGRHPPPAASGGRRCHITAEIGDDDGYAECLPRVRTTAERLVEDRSVGEQGRLSA